MKIDFSIGIEGWKAYIKTFLDFINDFWEQITGAPLFSESSAGALDTDLHAFDEE